LDGDGIIRWSFLSPIDVNPGADGILEALESLTGKSASSESKSARTEGEEARS
jgi:hypothetical protein